MAFYTPAGTKVLNLPEQVQKNLEDIAELKTLVGTKQDSSTAVTTENLKEQVEAVGSFDLKDISTTSINNTGNLTNNGTADIEGNTTLGSDVEVDGDATLNSPENAKFQTGSLDFSELTNFIATYWSMAGIGRFQGHTMKLSANTYYATPYTLPFASFSNITDGTMMFEGFKVVQISAGGDERLITGALIFPDFNEPLNNELMFANLGNPVIRLGNLTLKADYSSQGAFENQSVLTTIEVADGKSVKVVGWHEQLFYNSPSLVEIGAFDMSECTYLSRAFFQCTSLKSLHCTHWKVSFDISASTQFEESDLVEIIGNLDTVSTAQTLTMGSTNLAKLTEDEILVATGKGWTLA